MTSVTLLIIELVICLILSLILYKKNQINVTIEEVNVLAKKISKKGLKFPKLK